MPPVDPTNQPQGAPNEPPMKPSVQKLQFDDVFDTQQIEEEMKRVFRISKVIETEEKKSADIHLKYLKIVQTAERFKHTELVREKKEMLKLLEEEMRVQKNLAMGAVPHGPQRVAAGKQVEAEFAAKMAQVETKYKPQIASQNLRAMASEGSGVLSGVTSKLAEFIEILPKLGTAMGAMSVIVTGLLAVFKLGMDRLADLTKIQASLRAGGVGLNESARGVQSALKYFNIVGQDMEELGQSTGEVDKLVSVLAKSPDVLQDLVSKGGPDAWKTIRNAMLEFGISADDTADMLVTASKQQNLSMTEVGKNFGRAAYVAKQSNMSFKDAFNGLMNISAEMRNMTFNTEEARKVFTSTYLALRQIGDMKGFSQQDAQKFAANFSGALGSMTVDKLTGVLAFVKGRMPTQDELVQGMGFDEVMKFFDKIMGGTFTSKDASAMNKIAKGMETLGMSMGDNPKLAAKEMQTVLMNWKANVGTATEKSTNSALEKEMKAREEQSKKDMKALEDAQKIGAEAAKQMVDPLTKLSTALGTFADKFVSQFAGEFSTFAANFDKFVRLTTFQSVKDTGHEMVRDTKRLAGLDDPQYHSTVERDMDRRARSRQRKQLAHFLVKSMTGL